MRRMGRERSRPEGVRLRLLQPWMMIRSLPHTYCRPGLDSIRRARGMSVLTLITPTMTQAWMLQP